MILELGTKVLHPLYPQWGEGTVLNAHINDDGHEFYEIQFESRKGPGHWSKENLMDIDGHPLSKALPKPPTPAALRAIKKQEEKEQKKAVHEEVIRSAVNYLSNILDQVRLEEVHAKTKEVAEALDHHFEKHDVDLKVYVNPRYFGCHILLRFPLLPDNPPPFPVVDQGRVGYRGPESKRLPQGILRRGIIELCNTEVALRLIELGLKRKDS